MPRTPLGEISSNARRGPDSTQFDIGKVWYAKEIGHNPTTASRVLKKARSTVQSIFLRLDEDPTATLKPRSGRPRILSRRDERLILRAIRKDPYLSSRKIIMESGVKYYIKTIRRILERYGIAHWISKKRPLLTPKHAKERLQWCYIRKD